MGQAAERAFPVPLPAGIEAPATRQAIREAGELIRSAWIELGAEHSDQGDYLRALYSKEALQYPYLGDPDEVAVVNPLPQAEWIEFGRAGFHLAEHWGRGGGQWRVGKSGKRFAHVPFRHRTPVRAGGGSTPSRRRTAMHSPVYGLAKRMEEGDRLVGFGGAFKQSKSYAYYRQIFQDVPDYLPTGYTWKTSPFEGMTRTTRETPGGGRHTAYTTFRTITPESEGWYIPPSPAYHVAERALEQATPKIRELLEVAAAADLAAAVVNAAISLE